MRRRFLLFIAALLLAATAHSQDAPIVKNMGRRLASRNFNALQSYIKKHGQTYNWKCLRDMAPGYKEGILTFRYDVPEKDNPGISAVYNFRVQVITTSTTIAYYELSEEKNRKVNGDWQPYFDVISSYKNNTLYAQMQAAFKSVFHVAPNDKDLFNTGFVYGSECGIAGADPDGRKIVKYLVAARQKEVLVSWLQSANTEKQLYAIDGLYQLKRIGVKLSAGELSMIKYVKAKKGTVSVCSGCIYASDDIQAQTKGFTF